MGAMLQHDYIVSLYSNDTTFTLFSGVSQEPSMFYLDQLMPVVSKSVLMLNESSEELERKTVELQRAVGGRIYSFLMGLLLMYNTNNQDPDTIKKYFTILSVPGMPRTELKNLSITEFFKICGDKVAWYKCETYLEPIIKQERKRDTTKLEQILEDIKASIRSYLKDRIVYIDNRAIYIVDYQYDQYSAEEWPFLQEVALNHLGPKTENMRFSIIKKDRFGDPTQASDSHQGTMVTPSTKPLPRSNSKEDVVRQEKITVS